jgi:hypothetical protein
MASPVTFHLFSFSKEDAQGLLFPEGSIVFQALNFPVDTANHTWIPTRGVTVWRSTGSNPFEGQWYAPLVPPPGDEGIGTQGTARVEQYLAHSRRPELRVYPLSSLTVGDEVVQALEFRDKNIVFHRLGHSIELDLSGVPQHQRFTLVAEWSPVHLELRANWAEGEGLEEFYSGEGIPGEEWGRYEPPNRGTLRQYRARTDFALTVRVNDCETVAAGI